MICNLYYALYDKELYWLTADQVDLYAKWGKIHICVIENVPLDQMQKEKDWFYSRYGNPLTIDGETARFLWQVRQTQREQKELRSDNGAEKRVPD